MHEFLPSVISIDPRTAVDLDDAIGVRIDGQHLVADICLPDVPAFVTPGSGLDAQALERGMTIYRSNAVKQPMLSPEVTSHLTLSPNSAQMMIWVELRYTHDMQSAGVSLKRIRHKTAAQITYNQADDILQNQQHPLHKKLTDLSIFAQALHNRRHKRTGALFDVTSGLYTAEDGTVQMLAEQDRYQSHMIVMEFMIAANSALAELAHQQGAHIIYRNHKPESVSSGEREAIIAELEQIHGMDPQTAQAHIQHIACRVGAATLGVTSQGHWGLDTKHYAWFTSPLRRYPDIVNLRALVEDVQDPDLEAKAEHLTALYQESGKGQQQYMKAKAHREIYNRLQSRGLSAIDDIALKTAVNALESHGQCDTPVMAGLIAHRLKCGNYTIPHLIDLLINQVGVTRQDVIGPVAKVILQSENIGYAGSLLLKSEQISKLPIQEDGTIASATMLKDLLLTKGRPLPEIVTKQASTENVTEILCDRGAIKRAFQKLDEEDAALNSKSKVLEIAAKHKAQVVFETVGKSGPDHEPMFEVSAVWTGKGQKLTGRGIARSISLAERYASRNILSELPGIEDIAVAPIDTTKHPKSSLLEHASLNGGKLSVGKSVISGPAHQPHFDLQVQYTCKQGRFTGEGSASSKKEAERRACQCIVEELFAKAHQPAADEKEAAS